MEGRWAALALRAQRDGVLNYKEYGGRDQDWIGKEFLLLGTLESGMLAGYGKAILPGLKGDGKLEMFDLILRHEMPWIARAEARARSPEALAAAYRQAKQQDGR